MNSRWRSSAASVEIGTITSASAPLRVNHAPDLPLAVDLDGTLIRTDLLLEGLRLLLRQRPWDAWRLAGWLLRGRARFKEQLASLVQPPVHALPYNEPFVGFLRAERTAGRTLLLVTASPRRWADAVARHIGLFDEVLATECGRNLKGERKAALLVERFGERGFVYAGDARPDIAVWRRARSAIVVNPPPGLVRRLARETTIEREFD